MQVVSLKLKQKVQECEETLSEEKLDTEKEANVLEKEKITNKTDDLNKGIVEREREQWFPKRGAGKRGSLY